MARYIDADEFFQTLGFYEQSFDENRDFSARQTILQIMHELENAPTADVVEVIHAKWEINSDGYYPYCSNCKTEPKNGVMSKHCPECGAKMDVSDINVGNK